MSSDGCAMDDDRLLDLYWDAVARGSDVPAIGPDPALALIVRQLHARDDALEANPRYAESLWEDMMSSTVLAPPARPRSLSPTLQPTSKPASGRRFGWSAERPARWATAAMATVVMVAIIVVAVYATSQLAGLGSRGADQPASLAIQENADDHSLVGSWIVVAGGSSTTRPPLLMTFGADGTMLVTDRAAGNTGHGDWVVTNDGVAFEFITVELDDNDTYSGMTTAHGEISIAPAANEWTGVYRTFLTTPAGNVPFAMVDTELNGGRIVAEPPRGPDQGPATPSRD